MNDEIYSEFFKWLGIALMWLIVLGFSIKVLLAIILS